MAGCILVSLGSSVVWLMNLIEYVSGFLICDFVCLELGLLGLMLGFEFWGWLGGGCVVWVLSGLVWLGFGVAIRFFDFVL